MLFCSMPNHSDSVFEPYSSVFMSPNFKKLVGHIAFGACVGAWVRPRVRVSHFFVPTVTFIPLKLES